MTEMTPEKMKRFEALARLEFYIQELKDSKLDQLLDEAGFPRPKNTVWSVDFTDPKWKEKALVQGITVREQPHTAGEGER